MSLFCNTKLLISGHIAKKTLRNRTGPLLLFVHIVVSILCYAKMWAVVGTSRPVVDLWRGCSTYVIACDLDASGHKLLAGVAGLIATSPCQTRPNEALSRCASLFLCSDYLRRYPSLLPIILILRAFKCPTDLNSSLRKGLMCSVPRTSSSWQDLALVLPIHQAIWLLYL